MIDRFQEQLGGKIYRFILSNMDLLYLVLSFNAYEQTGHGSRRSWIPNVLSFPTSNIVPNRTIDAP